MDLSKIAELGLMSQQAVDKAKSDALTQMLFNIGGAFSAAGAPSRVPGGRPLNLAPVFQGYQNSLANSMKQALMLKQLERQEAEYTRKQADREDIKSALTSKPVTRHVPTGAQLKVTDLSYQPKTDWRGNNMPTSGPGSMWNKPGYDGFNPSQTVLAPETRAVTEETNPVLKSIPEGLRPILTALGQGGAGKETIGAVLAAALKPRSTGAYNSYLLDGKPTVLNRQEVSTLRNQGHEIAPYSTAKNNEGTYLVTSPEGETTIEFLTPAQRDNRSEKSGATIVPYANPSARRYQNLGPYKLLDGTIIEASFDRQTSERYYEKDGEKLPIPKGAIPITEASIAVELTKGIPTFGQFTKLRSDLLDNRISLENMSKYMKNINDAEQGYSRLADQFSTWTKTFLSSNAKTYKLSESELALKVAKGQLQGLLGKFRIETVGGGVMTEQDALRVISNLGGSVNLLQNKAVVVKQLKRLYRQKLMAFEQKRESYEIVRGRGYSSYKPIKPIPHNNIFNPQAPDAATVINYDSKGNRID